VHNHHISLGNVTSGGTLSNITALMVAREKAFPPDGEFPGLRIAGSDKALRYYGYSRGVVIVSTRGHYSITKAVNLLGLGEANVVHVPVDNNYHMDTKKLRRKIKSLQEDAHDRAKVVAVIGIAGTTETGNIDDLDAIAEISQEAGVHFHVDAAWGGPALLVDEYRPLFKGIEKADSVAIDTHKLLFCPISMGMVLFRSEKDLNMIKHSSNYIIRRNSVDTGRFTIEGSRPFACLKPWAALKIIGRKGYGLLFKHARESTNHLRNILDHCGNFEVLNDPELFILNYRFIPETVREQISLLQGISTYSNRDKAHAAEKKVRTINKLINSLNIKLHRELRTDDSTFVSRTTLEATRYRPQSIVVLRAVLINPLTDKNVLNEIVKTQNRIGVKIWREFKPAYLRIRDDV